MTVEAPAGLAASRAEVFLAQVEGELEESLGKERARLAAAAPDAATLVDELTRIIQAGGKRLRPLFCYWGHLATGGTEGEGIVRAAAALELLHTFAVIHDDVMDRSHFRRGQPTSFRLLGRRGEDQVTEGDPDHDRFGRSAAILAGDLAQALADRMLAESAFPPDRLLEAFGPFNDMRTLAVAGQFLDLLFAGRGWADEADARRVASLKSASYTVVGPLLLGATLAGADPALKDSLASYGWPLGEAFQLRDDILGTFGHPGMTGKDSDTDIIEGKRTTLVAKAVRLAEAGSEPRELLERRLGSPDLTPAEIEGIREAMRDSGALVETLALIDSLAAEAVRAIRKAPVGQEARAAMEALAELVVLRET